MQATLQYLLSRSKPLVRSGRGNIFGSMSCPGCNSTERKMCRSSVLEVCMNRGRNRALFAGNSNGSIFGGLEGKKPELLVDEGQRA